MEFVDDVELKQADMTVNGDLLRLDQEEMRYSEQLNKYVEEGTNSLKIEPEETIDVVELKVQLET